MAAGLSESVAQKDDPKSKAEVVKIISNEIVQAVLEVLLNQLWALLLNSSSITRNLSLAVPILLEIYKIAKILVKITDISKKAKGNFLQLVKLLAKLISKEASKIVGK